MSIAVVTGLTGNFSKLHKTTIKNSYVVTTIRGDEFKKYATQQGWSVINADAAHSSCLNEASMQSKYIKILHWFKPNADYVLYIDHKYKLKYRNVTCIILKLLT